ncbi:unnamed protein product, partial [Musa textilis]
SIASFGLSYSLHLFSLALIDTSSSPTFVDFTCVHSVCTLQSRLCHDPTLAFPLLTS